VCTFENCTKMVSVELNNGLEFIQQQGFRNCASLESIIIPSTVKEIGTRGFEFCSRLANVQLNEGLELIAN
jgi:hypothetical protein